MKLLTTKLPEYFSSRIVQNNESCWLWQDKLNKKGYPFRIYYKCKRDNPLRILFHKLVGKIPDKFVMDHKECKNYHCINPFHAEAVTNKENIRRGRACKLTLEKAIEIKSLYSTGNYKQKELAVMFKVGRSTIAMVLCNGNWKDSGMAISGLKNY